MTAVRAAIMVVKVTASGIRMPLPMVRATSRPVAAPVKLNNAARATAARGVMARVPMAVAVALAASFMPLVNPKPVASRMMAAKKMMLDSGMLEGYSLKDVGHVLGPVRGGLEVLVNLAPFNEQGKVVGVLE